MAKWIGLRVTKVSSDSRQPSLLSAAAAAYHLIELVTRDVTAHLLSQFRDL